MSLIKGYNCAGHPGLRGFLHAVDRRGKEPAYSGWIALAKVYYRDGMRLGGKTVMQRGARQQPFQTKLIGDQDAALGVRCSRVQGRWDVRSGCSGMQAAAYARFG